MKSGYKGARYAKSNPKVLAEAKVTSEGPVLSAQAVKSPMGTAATSGANAIGGKKSAMRLDRPGRKMGGRVGADCAPLSSAATTSKRE